MLKKTGNDKENGDDSWRTKRNIGYTTTWVKEALFQIQREKERTLDKYKERKWFAEKSQTRYQNDKIWIRK